MSQIGDEWEDYFERYSTWAQAEAGHARLVQAAMRDILGVHDALSGIFTRKTADTAS